MLKLKLPYFGHLMRRTDSLEKTLMLDKFEGRRRRGSQRMRWLDGINGFNRHEFEQAPGVYDRQGSLASCGAAVPGFAELDTTEQLSWTERCCIIPFSPLFQYCPSEVRRHSHLWYTGSLFCSLAFLLAFRTSTFSSGFRSPTVPWYYKLTRIIFYLFSQTLKGPFNLETSDLENSF